MGSSGPAAGAGSEVSADVAALVAAEVPTGENSIGAAGNAGRPPWAAAAPGTAVAGPVRAVHPARARPRTPMRPAADPGDTAPWDVPAAEAQRAGRIRRSRAAPQAAARVFDVAATRRRPVIFEEDDDLDVPDFLK